MKVPKSNNEYAKNQSTREGSAFVLLSKITKAITLSKETELLLRDICHITIEEGPFASSSFEFVNKASNNLETFAKAGIINNLVDFSVDRNPIFKVVETKKKITSNSIDSDSTLSVEWKNKCIPLGYKSFGIFPISTACGLTGCFCIYSEEVGLFTELEISLFTDLSAIISYALENIERNKGFKQKETALIESELKYRMMVDNAPLGYQSLDIDGNFLTVNQVWLDTLGYERDEVLGKWFGDFLVPKYQDAFRKRFPIFKAQGTIHSEFEMVHKNGKTLYIAFDGRIDTDNNGNFKQTHCILKDISEQKQAQKELILSEEKYRSVVENIHEALIIEDVNGRLIYANDEYCKMFGYSRDELTSLRLKDYIAPEWYQIVFDRHTLRMKGLDVPNEFEYEGIHKDGSRIWIEGRVTILKEGNKIVGTQSLEKEITQRKKLEEELLHEQLLMKTLMNHLPGIFFLYSYPELRLLRWNKNHEDLLGYSVEDLTARSVKDWKESDFKNRALKGIDYIVSNQQTIIEVDIDSKNGQSTPFIITGILLDFQGKKHIMGIGIDSSERKQAEQNLLNLKNSLEEMVINNTKELHEKIDELERFRDATVDRELRMKELREEINLLKSNR